MCRWLLYYGLPTVPYSLLFVADRALVTSAEVTTRYTPFIEDNEENNKRNHIINVHGSGLGWYMIKHNIFRKSYRDRFGLNLWEAPKIYTGILAPSHDRNLRRLSEATESSLYFAHVRAAAPFTPINQYNSHPFRRGRYMLMHNGGIAKFRSIKKKLYQKITDSLFELIEGTTDTEVFFSLFLSFLPNSDYTRIYKVEVLKKALVKALAAVESETKGLEKWNNELDNAHRSSMNVAISDGEKCVVLRYRTGAHTEPPSLYICTHEGYHMPDPNDQILKKRSSTSMQMRSIRSHIKLMNLTPHSCTSPEQITSPLLSTTSTTSTTSIISSTVFSTTTLENTVLIASEPLDHIDMGSEKRHWEIIEANTITVIEPMRLSIDGCEKVSRSIFEKSFTQQHVPDGDYTLQITKSKVTLEMLQEELNECQSHV